MADWKQLMIQLINKHFGADNVVIKEINNNLDVTIVDRKIAFTVLHGKSWIETKKYIDKILDDSIESKDNLCTICYETQRAFTGCASCHNRWCMQCCSNMIRKTKGLIVCPYCKHTVGKRGPAMCAEVIAQRMLHRAMVAC